jgi:hypothetical protein
MLTAECSKMQTRPSPAKKPTITFKITLHKPAVVRRNGCVEAAAAVSPALR